jgi:hypothetical protein
MCWTHQAPAGAGVGSGRWQRFIRSKGGGDTCDTTGPSPAHLTGPRTDLSSQVAPGTPTGPRCVFWGRGLPGSGQLLKPPSDSLWGPSHLLLVIDRNVVGWPSIHIEACRRYCKCLAVAGHRLGACQHDLPALRRSPTNGMIIDRRIDHRIFKGRTRHGVRL